MNLTIGRIYPDLLNLNGSRGNIMPLVKRLEWRGIQVKVREFYCGEPVDFSCLDIAVADGGAQRAQEEACKLLRRVKDEFKAYVEGGGVTLALCGSFPMLGEYYFTENTRVEGLNILDITSKWSPKRFTGNIRLDCPISLRQPVYGFENHNSRTEIGPYKPFGKVTHGHGNDGSGKEGLIYKNLIATNVHGPLLPKNPQIADWLISKALSKKYGGDIRLEPLDDTLEALAGEEASSLFTAKSLLSRL